MGKSNVYENTNTIITLATSPLAVKVIFCYIKRALISPFFYVLSTSFTLLHLLLVALRTNITNTE
jgi:hypothetical protein